MLKHLDLFSGIGGFALASRMVGGIKTIQFVEIDPYCQKVLAKNFPGIPCHDDITTFTAEPGRFDIVTGGFPCQDISISAASVGAPHLRERVFVVAHPNGSGRKKLNATTIPTQSGHDTRCITPEWNPWATEPGVLPVANEIPNELDRIRACGNAIVPQVGAIALQRVLEIDSLTN